MKTDITDWTRHQQRSAPLPGGVLEARANTEREKARHRPPSPLDLARDTALTLHPNPITWTRPDGEIDLARRYSQRNPDGSIALTSTDRVALVSAPARRLFGEAVLYAAAATVNIRDTSRPVCRWCLAAAGSRVDGVDSPQVLSWKGALAGDWSMARALGLLLGTPCRKCAGKVPSAAR